MLKREKKTAKNKAAVTDAISGEEKRLLVSGTASAPRSMSIGLPGSAPVLAAIPVQNIGVTQQLTFIAAVIARAVRATPPSQAVRPILTRNRQSTAS